MFRQQGENMDAPIITIFARHSLDCPHIGDDSTSGATAGSISGGPTTASSIVAPRNQRRGPEPKDQAGSRVVLRNGREARTAGSPATVRQAVETFILDKQGQNLNAGVLGKYRRELARLVDFSEHRGKFYLQEIALPDLTEFRSSWESDYPSSLTRQRVQARLRLLSLCSQRGIHSAQPRRRHVSHQSCTSPDPSPDGSSIQKASRNHSRRVSRGNQAAESMR